MKHIRYKWKLYYFLSNIIVKVMLITNQLVATAPKMIWLGLTDLNLDKMSTYLFFVFTDRLFDNRFLGRKYMYGKVYLKCFKIKPSFLHYLWVIIAQSNSKSITSGITSGNTWCHLRISIFSHYGVVKPLKMKPFELPFRE